jgi:mandelate racemase
MRLESLTLRSIRARAVLLKLKRPIVARVATIPNSSIILIDLLTEEGVVKRSYLEPYTAKAMRYLIPCFTILGTCSMAVA